MVWGFSCSCFMFSFRSLVCMFLLMEKLTSCIQVTSSVGKKLSAILMKYVSFKYKLLTVLSADHAKRGSSLATELWLTQFCVGKDVPVESDSYKKIYFTNYFITYEEVSFPVIVHRGVVCYLNSMLCIYHPVSKIYVHLESINILLKLLCICEII